MYRRRTVMEIPEFYVGMLIHLWLGDVWWETYKEKPWKIFKKEIWKTPKNPTFFNQKKLIGYSYKTEQNYEPGFTRNE